MPFARRPDSWIILSRPIRPRNRAATTATCSDDSLSEFTSETPRQAIVESNVSFAAGAGRNDVTTSPTRIENPTVDLHAATHLPTGLHTFERRALRLVASLATYVRRPRARSTWASSVSLWIGRVRNLRRRPTTSTTLSSFAGGAATGVLVMWFVGIQPPPTVVPSTTHAVTPEATLAPPDLRASSPDVQPAAAEGMSASSTSRPSPLVPAISRPVGTSGRRIGDVRQAVRPSRAASAAPARSRNAAGTTSSAYRGSLAFESAPQGSRVFVNGAFVGSTPLVLQNLAVGSRAVRIEADGYQRWSASTRVVANQQTRVSATLAHAVP